jgi:hypothetical protein
MPNDHFNSDIRQKNQEDILLTPWGRDAQEDFSVNEQVEKVILTPKEVKKQITAGRFPFTRVVYKEINEESVKVTQELYRRDATDRIVRNDDVAGFSWRDNLPIPHDSMDFCACHYEEEGKTIWVYLTVDGSKTKKGNTLCEECKKRQKRKVFWKKVFIVGLLSDPEKY